MLRIIESNCMGCENCIMLAPDNFEFDWKTGLVKIIDQTITSEVQDAIDCCPCIAIVND